MYLINSFVAAFFLLMIMSQPVTASSSNCSYSKSIKQGGMVFDINSRPAIGCAVQIVTVNVRRGGKKIAGAKADVDYLAKSAQAVDLTGEGRLELVVISLSTEVGVTESLDVYWLDGTTLNRSTAPEFYGKTGYRGGDRFNLEGRLIVRSFPVYLDGDTLEKPTGGTRSLKYEFKEGVFTLYVQAEGSANPSDDSSAQKSPRPAVPLPVEAKTEPLPVEAKTAVSAAAGLTIAGITASEAGIAIRADGPIEKFKTMKLEKPERIAIDIAGADSSLVGKKISINKFGISTVRVGSNKGFLRFVLETNLKKFPKYEVKSSGTGLLVEFKQ